MAACQLSKLEVATLRGGRQASGGNGASLAEAAQGERPRGDDEVTMKQRGDVGVPAEGAGGWESSTLRGFGDWMSEGIMARATPNTSDAVSVLGQSRRGCIVARASPTPLTLLCHMVLWAKGERPHRGRKGPKEKQSAWRENLTCQSTAEDLCFASSGNSSPTSLLLVSVSRRQSTTTQFRGAGVEPLNCPRAV